MSSSIDIKVESTDQDGLKITYSEVEGLLFNGINVTDEIRRNFSKVVGNVSKKLGITLSYKTISSTGLPRDIDSSTGPALVEFDLNSTFAPQHQPYVGDVLDALAEEITLFLDTHKTIAHLLSTTSEGEILTFAKAAPPKLETKVDLASNQLGRLKSSIVNNLPNLNLANDLSSEIRINVLSDTFFDELKSEAIAMVNSKLTQQPEPITKQLLQNDSLANLGVDWDDKKYDQKLILLRKELDDFLFKELNAILVIISDYLASQTPPQTVPGAVRVMLLERLSGYRQSLFVGVPRFTLKPFGFDQKMDKDVFEVLTNYMPEDAVEVVLKEQCDAVRLSPTGNIDFTTVRKYYSNRNTELPSKISAADRKMASSLSFSDELLGDALAELAEETDLAKYAQIFAHVVVEKAEDELGTMPPMTPEKLKLIYPKVLQLSGIPDSSTLYTDSKNLFDYYLKDALDDLVVDILKLAPAENPLEKGFDVLVVIGYNDKQLYDLDRSLANLQMVSETFERAGNNGLPNPISVYMKKLIEAYEKKLAAARESGKLTASQLERLDRIESAISHLDEPYIITPIDKDYRNDKELKKAFIRNYAEQRSKLAELMLKRAQQNYEKAIKRYTGSGSRWAGRPKITAEELKQAKDSYELALRKRESVESEGAHARQILEAVLRLDDEIAAEMEATAKKEKYLRRRGQASMYIEKAKTLAKPAVIVLGGLGLGVLGGPVLLGAGAAVAGAGLARNRLNSSEMTDYDTALLTTNTDVANAASRRQSELVDLARQAETLRRIIESVTRQAENLLVQAGGVGASMTDEEVSFRMNVYDSMWNRVLQDNFTDNSGKRVSTMIEYMNPINENLNRGFDYTFQQVGDQYNTQLDELVDIRQRAGVRSLGIWQRVRRGLLGF